MSMILDGTNGATFNDGSLQGAAASPYVLKNRIINGAMQVWQRGTTFTSVASGYLADRWTFSTSLSITATQSTDVPNVQYLYSLKVVPASNGTAAEFVVRQFIEQQNITDLAGQTVTVSAWVKSSQTSLKVRLSSQNATGGVDTPQSITVTANTWTKITATFTTFSAVTAWTSTPNSSGGFLDIGYANSTALTTSDSLYITGVQLEIGTSATPFERRLYNQELANCQRYCQVLGGGITGMFYSVPPSTNVSYGIQFKTTMRAVPTMAVLTGTTSVQVDDAGIGSVVMTTPSTPIIAGAGSSPNGIRVNSTSASSSGTATVYHTAICSSPDWIIFSAEL
jgi:hypothetical protein